MIVVQEGLEEECHRPVSGVSALLKWHIKTCFLINLLHLPPRWNKGMSKSG